MFSRLLGKPKEQTSALATIEKLYETLEMLEKKEKVLLKKSDAEIEKAKEFTKSKNKRAAIQRLKRKRLYEQQIEQLGNFQLRIHERSIAERYLAEECVVFCARYLDDVETRSNRASRNYDGNIDTRVELPIFVNPGRHLGGVNIVNWDVDTMKRAHQYVLFNCEMVQPFLSEHREMIHNQNPRLRIRDIERIHNESFASWFANQVQNMDFVNERGISEELKSLAQGPNFIGKRYKGFIINGFRFHVKQIEQRRKTQNSGVVVIAKTTSYSSVNDRNPVIGDVTYYGVLKEIVELEYFLSRKVVLFKCDWVGQGRMQRQDENGFTLVNLSRLMNTSEPFILASQAQQVFYAEDPIDKGWHVVIKTTPRDCFDMDRREEIDVEDYLLSETCTGDISDDNEEIRWIREGVLVFLHFHFALLKLLV